MKMNQLKLANSAAKIKANPEAMNSRLSATEEWTSDLGGGIMEITQSEQEHVCVSHSVVSSSLWPPGLSLEFSRQEYWSGLPFPSSGDLSDPGIKPGSPALQADSLPSGLEWQTERPKKKSNIRDLMG